MSDFDIFPTLDQPEVASTTRQASAVATTKPADVALEDIDLQKLALSHFDASDAALAIARQKLVGVVHDLSTATKLAEAKSLRQRLINDPLAEARKVNKGLKAKLTAVSKAVGSRLETLEAGFANVETLITPQIEARDAEVAAEKAERERKEAERTAAHRANIATLASYTSTAQGKTSAQILTIINGVSGIDIIPEQWEEFAVGAEIQKEQTLEALQALFNATKTAEDEAAAREAQRIENERVAAELAAKERALAEKQAEVDRKLAALAAAEQAEADRIDAAVRAQADEDSLVDGFMENARRIEFDSVPYIEKASRTYESMAPDWENDPRPRVREAMLAGRAYLAERLATAKQRAAEDEANARAQEAAADATPPEVVADACATPAADMAEITAKAWALPADPITFAEPPAPSQEATLTLSAMNDRFGGVLSLSAAGLSSLGFEPIATKKAAKLYSEAQFRAISDALVEHIGEVVSACEA